MSSYSRASHTSSWSSSSSSHSSRRTMASAFKVSDYFKLLGLLALTGLCFYSATVKFIIPMTMSNASNKPHITIVPDYTVCQDMLNRLQKTSTSSTLSELKQKCQLEILQAYTQAKLQCHGYINVAERCMQSGSSCNSERRNVDSCVDSQLQEKRTYWKEYQNVNA